MLMEGGFELIQREVGCAIHIKHGADAPVGFIELHNLRIATEGDIECMEFRFQFCRRGISGFQCGFKFLHNGLHLLDDAGVILNIADTELYTEKLHHLTCFNDISNLGIGKLCNGCALSRRCLYQTKRNQAVDCSKDRGAADAQLIGYFLRI